MSAEPTGELRDALIGAAAGLPVADWDGVREALRLRAVHGPAVDRMLSGPLAPLLADLGHARSAGESYRRQRNMLADKLAAVEEVVEHHSWGEEDPLAVRDALRQALRGDRR